MHLVGQKAESPHDADIEAENFVHQSAGPALSRQAAPEQRMEHRNSTSHNSTEPRQSSAKLKPWRSSARDS